MGNSRTKMALFGACRSLRNDVGMNGDFAAIRTFLSGVVPDAIALGSVAVADRDFIQELNRIAPVLELSGASPSPVTNAYGSPLTLGADRLANVTAAGKRFPGRAVLVIDPGTCITYDVCDADGVYAGGAISPGMQMRATAMNAYSARLPKVVPRSGPDALGTSTERSLEAGIHHGIVGEMREFVRLYGTERSDMAVVLTGGDGPRFARALESGIFAIPLLTLEGYHALLVHHRSLLAGTPSPDPGSGPGARSAG